MRSQLRRVEQATASTPPRLDTTAVVTSTAEDWSGVLDEFAVELERAEKLLAQGWTEEPDVLPPYPAVRWAPPQGIGRLPDELADYARALHTRQLTILDALRVALSANRRAAAVASTISNTDAPVRPLFIDTTG